MTKSKKVKIKLTLGEKLLYISAVFAFAFMFVIQIFFGARINNLKMRTDELKDIFKSYLFPFFIMFMVVMSSFFIRIGFVELTHVFQIRIRKTFSKLRSQFYG